MRTRKKSTKPKKYGLREAVRTSEQKSRTEGFRRLNKMMKKHIQPGHSVADELIAERRAEALNE